VAAILSFALAGAAAPIAQPAGSINAVTDYGVDPTGATDTTAKMQAAVNTGWPAAQLSELEAYTS
jgi:polygalacturonase